MTPAAAVAAAAAVVEASSGGRRSTRQCTCPASGTHGQLRLVYADHKALYSIRDVKTLHLNHVIRHRTLHASVDADHVCSDDRPSCPGDPFHASGSDGSSSSSSSRSQGLTCVRTLVAKSLHREKLRLTLCSPGAAMLLLAVVVPTKLGPGLILVPSDAIYLAVTCSGLQAC
eukprot:GHUV01047043.1.p1 GENE.GHUV01047043.1~~GHUV01047043.1.p1  ORF type:complete len:172 (+),score=57.37 GHUV01047043.1:48-563(+)